MLLSTLIAHIEELAPLSLQESFDNAGLLVGSRNKEIKKALVCVDVTNEVMDEAIDKHCDLIISHHHFLYENIKNINPDTSNGNILYRAIKNNIAMYAAHTNLDNVEAGVNGILCKKLNLRNTRILQPMQNVLKKMVTFCPIKHADKVRTALFEAGAGHIGNYDYCSYNIEGKGTFRAMNTANPFVGKKNEIHYENELRIEFIFPAFIEKKIVAALLLSHPYEEVAYDIYPLNNVYNKAGSGMIGELENSMTEKAFLDYVKKTVGISVLRHSSFTKKKIQKIAVCGGAGSFLINKAIENSADAFVTAEIRYHQFFDAEKKLLLVDAGHHETEQFVKEIIIDHLNKKFPKFAVLISRVNTNPVNYYY